jgi:hypothetical protein
MIVCSVILCQGTLLLRRACVTIFLTSHCGRLCGIFVCMALILGLDQRQVLSEFHTILSLLQKVHAYGQVIACLSQGKASSWGKMTGFPAFGVKSAFCVLDCSSINMKILHLIHCFPDIGSNMLAQLFFNSSAKHLEVHNFLI